MNDFQSHIDVWYGLYILQAAYISFCIYIYYIKVFKEWEIISYLIYSFSGMPKKFSAEEAGDLIVNDEFDIGEMDCAVSLDKDWS